MATAVALKLNELHDELLLVAAERGRSGPLVLTKVATISVPVADSETSGESTERTERSIFDELELDVDSTIALIPGEHVLYRTISLPFNQPKKVEQATPLQVQDYVPFDLDDFVLDHVVVGKTPDGAEYEVLTSLVPQSEIVAALEKLSSVGVDPKMLSTRASALALLETLLPDDAPETVALLELTSARAMLAIYINGELKLLRDMVRREDVGPSKQRLDTQVSADIVCSLASTERKYESPIERLYVLADTLDFERCQQSIPRPLTRLSLEGIVEVTAEVFQPVEELAWAVGLLSRELGQQKAQSPVVDFRRGAFAYKPVLRKLLQALQGEAFKILLCIVFSVGWFVSILYRADNSLAKVEERITTMVQAAVPGLSLPKRRELSELESKVAELEEQLRGIGSLSSLSPLESLRELSEAIGGDIDIDIESLNIGLSTLTFRGSVADNLSLGRLSGALEKRTNRFCSVKVDPKGRVPGSPRVKYVAEIELCE